MFVLSKGMSIATYVGGVVFRNIRFSHLNKDIAINYEYQKRYEVVRTAVDLLFGNLLSTRKEVEKYIFSRLQSFVMLIGSIFLKKLIFLSKKDLIN